MKILITTSTFAEYDKGPLERLEAKGCDVTLNPFGRRLSEREAAGLLKGVTGIIAGLEPLTRDVLKNSVLKVISRCGSGVSNVDMDAARELGIKVTRTPEAPAASVAELTIGALLNILRMIPEMNAGLHAGKWDKKTGGLIRGKTVLLIGFGRIGKEVSELLRAFGAGIIVCDPAVKIGVNGFETADLSGALPRADIIAIHASGHKEIIGVNEFNLMKKGVIVLNAARGGIVNEEALRGALDEGKISGAWLDTFSEEPYIGPLAGYPQVILTPHVGSYTIECRKSMEMEAVDNLIGALGL